MTSTRMPVLFVGHGSPMNAIEDTPWSRGQKALGTLLPEPKAIVAVSAHWYVPYTAVTAGEHPRTIHDFGGFPDDLYRIQYPAPGDPQLAGNITRMLAKWEAKPRADWGLDHGTWSVLRHMYPKAGCPVVQLSVNSEISAAEHVEIGQLLRPLREQGVLIFASGNVTHNLGHAMRFGHAGTPPWAEQFDRELAGAVASRDDGWLCDAAGSELGQLAHPSPDHYYPVLYAYGAADSSDSVSFPITGFDLSSLSMRAILFQ